MAEKETKQETMETPVQEAPAKEYVYSYTVKRGVDGSVDVEGNEIEGKETITAEAIYDDILSLCDLIKENRMAALIQKAVTETSYYAVRRALIDGAEAAKAQAEAAEPKVDL